MTYESWGFKSNPFETKSLKPTSEGDQLLVGRDKEVAQLQKRLENTSKYSTIEGLNGVGKTSLVNVATYRKFKSDIKNGNGLVIPCQTVFQLTSDLDVELFRRRILLSVAQTLFSVEDSLPIPPGETKDARLQALKKWINDPFIKSVGGGIGSVAISLNVGANTSSGFEESGVYSHIESILSELARSRVFIVCTLDNLELLETSEVARRILERLRDPVLNIQGLRWVFCGALGIMYGVVSSPRLSGYVQKPLVVTDLSRDLSKEVYRSRIMAYQTRGDARLPLSEANFETLFRVFRGNLREVLSTADEFCTHAGDLEDTGDLDGDAFELWLSSEIGVAQDAVAEGLRGASLKVFNRACEKEAFSPGDHEDFGYDTPMALRPQVKTLEDLGLLQSSKDENDKRRKNIQVTPKGWLVSEGMKRAAANGI